MLASGGELQGFEEFVHLALHPFVVDVELTAILGFPSLLEVAPVGEERLDDLLPEHVQGSHRPESILGGFVAP